MRPPEGGLRALRRDEGGAIMVLGIFMCACLVGVLWYLAGVGDAIVHHNRMQEASDAVAYSGAVLHARGMNLIVLVNLIMAMILAIRVALKVLELILTILLVVFTILCAVPWTAAFGCPAEGLTSSGRTVVQNIRKATDKPIDMALEALHQLEANVIARLTPIGAIAGSKQVADDYKPIVKVGAAADLKVVTGGLPVEDGTEDYLCMMAGEALGKLIAWPIEKAIGSGGVADKVGDAIGGMVSGIASASPGYFCGMGSNANPPDLSDIINKQAGDACNQEEDGHKQEYQKRTQAWLNACAKYPAVTCTPADDIFGTPSDMTGTDKIKPSEKAELDKLKQDMDSEKSARDNFDNGKCKKDKSKQMQQDINKQQSSSSSSSGNKKPMKPSKNYKQGDDTSQIVSLIYGTNFLIARGPKGAKAGAWTKGNAGITDPMAQAALQAFSQAEYFYDCDGDWKKASDCNGEHGKDESAMWHFKWRARLRRFSNPSMNAAIASVPLTYGVMTARAVRIYRLTGPGNSQLREKLIEAWAKNPFDQVLH